MQASAAQPQVDIVVSTFGGDAKIDGMIASIRRSTHQNFRLWILDQNPDDRTYERVKAHICVDERVKYCRVPELGMTPTRNFGVGLGNAPIVLFTNDDCRVAPGWIAAMVQELRDERTWCVSGRVLADGAEPSLAQDDRTVVAIQEHDRREVFDADRRAVNYVQGHNLGLRREAFARLGGFDEQFGVGRPLRSTDDRDIAYRVGLQRGRFVYAPDAIVYHCHWQDWAGIARSYRGYAAGMGALTAKFIRCGQPHALLLLAKWIWAFGIEWLIEGMRVPEKRPQLRIAVRQFIDPWSGFLQALTLPVDKDRMVFVRDEAAVGKAIGAARATERT